MAKISLPFGLERNNGEGVTNATEIDVTTEGGQTVALSAFLAALHKLELVYVNALPAASANTMGKIYLVPKTSGIEDKNSCDEFITLDNGASTSPRYLWEHIGDLAVDLSDYATTEAMNAAIASALASCVTTTVMNAALADKQDVISDLTTIRSGASSGATAYQKPQDGIPNADLAAAVQTSLNKADTALQEHQDISGKVDKVTGKGLSTNDYTTADKNKLAGIAEGAQVNVQPNWSQTNTLADDYIKNKPSRLPASDVQEWAKALVKPSYTASEVGVTTIPGLSSTNVQAALVEIIGLGVAGQWHLGTVINTNNSTTVVTGAKVGDLYLNTDTTNAAFGNVYQLTDVSGTAKWVFQLNIIAKVALRTSTDANNYTHAYLDITNGGTTTQGTQDLMAPVNDVLSAIDSILNPSVSTLSTQQEPE